MKKGIHPENYRPVVFRMNAFFHFSIYFLLLLLTNKYVVTLVKCVMVYFGLQRYAISLKLKRNTRKKYSVTQRLLYK